MFPVMTYDIASVSAIIQLAMAPAFLLVALSGLLQLFAGRLARVVDRERALEVLHASSTGDAHRRQVLELRVIDKRLKTINRAFLCAVAAAITIALLIVSMFAMSLLQTGVAYLVAGGFGIAMLLVIASLGFFLHEIRLSSRIILVPEELLERGEDF